MTGIPGWLTAGALVAIAAWLWLAMPGRYQIAPTTRPHLVHRLDTRTGALELFELSDRPPEQHDRMQYYPLGALADVPRP